MRWETNAEPGSGMNILDLIFEKLVFVLKVLKFFDADPDPGSFQPWIRDPGWKKNRIRDKHPGSATLLLFGSGKG
jgi:hypothetical protein